jgi:methionyl-tRNA formyltransferase
VNGNRWGIWKVQVKEHDGNAALLSKDNSSAPGTIMGVTKHAILVQTGHGMLHLIEIQPANKKRMAVADYVAGHHIEVGMRCVGKSG